MTDTELLKLSAKAAGYKVSNRLVGGGLMVMSNERPTPHKWNPLDDDGDALRLAVKLCIVFYFVEGDMIQKPHVRAGVLLTSGGIVQPADATGWEVATRRSIVRAAASIGEKIK